MTAALLLAAGGGVLGPSMAKAQTPWVAPAPDTVEQGEKVTKVNCVACHGAGGKGDGPAAVALNPDDTDGELFWKITTGRGAMPAWRHLAETDRWAIVQYIRSLGGK